MPQSPQFAGSFEVSTHASPHVFADGPTQPAPVDTEADAAVEVVVDVVAALPPAPVEVLPPFDEQPPRASAPTTAMTPAAVRHLPILENSPPFVQSIDSTLPSSSTITFTRLQIEAARMDGWMGERHRIVRRGQDDKRSLRSEKLLNEFALQEHCASRLRNGAVPSGLRARPAKPTPSGLRGARKATRRRPASGSPQGVAIKTAARPRNRRCRTRSVQRLQ